MLASFILWKLLRKTVLVRNMAKYRLPHLYQSFRVSLTILSTRKKMVSDLFDPTLQNLPIFSFRQRPQLSFDVFGKMPGIVPVRNISVVFSNPFNDLSVAISGNFYYGIFT